MATSRKFFEKKVKFLRKHFAIAQAIFSGYYSIGIEANKKKLIVLARKELSYSDKTVGSDIFRGLSKVWISMVKK